MVSTLYGKESNSFQTNPFRAAFIKACKATTNNFEGGLLAKSKHPELKTYSDVITANYVLPNEYLNKVKKSAIVFNTPAVWGCLGWKLGEFLAMGKAIISTPLHNEMPYQLEHGKNIHFVNTESEIKVAVERIQNDLSYRRKLEMGAKAYFDAYLAPEVIIKRLIQKK